MSSKAQTREKDYERGLRIADSRKAIGLSQDELAHRVGIGRQAISTIFNRRYCLSAYTLSLIHI